MRLDLNDNAKSDLNGTVERLDVQASGNTTADLSSLLAQDVEVTLGGNSNVHLEAARSVTGRASGNSKLKIHKAADHTTSAASASDNASVNFE